MSMEDLYEDYLIDAQVAEDDAYRRIEYGEWTTRDGAVMKVEKMSTDHINRCVALMKRRKDDYAECWVARFEKELDRRKEVNRNDSRKDNCSYTENRR